MVSTRRQDHPTEAKKEDVPASGRVSTRSSSGIAPRDRRDHRNYEYSHSVHLRHDSPERAVPTRNLRDRKLLAQSVEVEAVSLPTKPGESLTKKQIKRLDVGHLSPHNGNCEEYRRSSRQRKLLYDTFDEAAISGHIALHSHEYNHKQTQKQSDSRTKLSGNEESLKNATELGDFEMDMYTRVKRARRQVKRDMYGMPLVEEEGKSTEEDLSTENDDQEEEEEEEKSEQGEGGVQYNLRRRKPQTQLYEASIEKKDRHKSYYKLTPPKSKYRDRHTDEYKSPAHRRKRKREAFHRSSSTSSSSSESEDERRFERRKAKSMVRSRQRCLPMNLGVSDISGVMKDRQKIGASLADIDPMSLDRSVTFDSVGGLKEHIRSLKEMIVFPLMYPEVFERFKITPPRGVLFYGPPGTGKTLVARALANECSKGDKRVSFFMRKGADCLSKWVGESERQLRLLFDQAYQLRPSIIFFDEIDGLAPVRSSRQDQIHSSIVSTLLALMDGLDSRGEVVVIGATNRIDSIDPALRRPGRFDREFLFTLPSAQARADILRILTKEWNPPLHSSFIDELAARCNGYCGADMKALCTEAALRALRRRYPQIYVCSDKLQLDVSSIDIAPQDFHYAISQIVPAGQRAVISVGRSLSPMIKPLLARQLAAVIKLISGSFPYVSKDKTTDHCHDELFDMLYEESQSASACISARPKNRSLVNGNISSAPEHFLESVMSASRTPVVSRPRLLIYGQADQGHTTHLAPALLHHMESLPVHVLDLPTLYANSARTPEESCAQVFREARRVTPCTLFIPHIDTWWQVLSDTLRATFLTMLGDFDPSIPILLIATSEEPIENLPAEVQTLFCASVQELYRMENPQRDEILCFFEDLLLNQTCIPPPSKKKAAQTLLEVLPVAPPPKPVQLTAQEEKLLWEQEEGVLRELRLFLRDILNKLARDRKFNIFSKPVDDEDVPDYYDIIKNPMDLQTIMSKIDLHQYETVQEFLRDIELITQNALEYNPDTNPLGRAVRHRACALKDVADALIDAELDQEFEKQCRSIAESRKRRGVSGTKSAPKYYRTVHPDQAQFRFSRRLRGETPRLPSESAPAQQEDCFVRVRSADEYQNALGKEPKGVETNANNSACTLASASEKSTHSPKKHLRNKSPWIYTRRRRRKQMLSMMHARQSRQAKSKTKIVPSSGEENENDLTKKASSGEVSVNGLRRLSVDLSVHIANHPKLCDSSPPSNSTSSPNLSHYPALIDNQCTNITQKQLDAVNNISTEPEADEELSQLQTFTRTQINAHSSDSCELTDDEHLPTPVHMPDSFLPELQVASTAPPINTISVATESLINGDDECEIVLVEKTEIISDYVSKDKNYAHFNAGSPSFQQKASIKPEDPVTTVRLTRSMAADHRSMKCREILEEQLPPFVIERAALPSILKRAVDVGMRCHVSQLEKLFSLLAQKIYLHRQEYDRTALLQDLDKVLNDFCHTMKTM